MIKKILTTVAVLVIALPAAAQTVDGEANVRIGAEVKGRPGLEANVKPQMRPIKGEIKEMRGEFRDERKEDMKEFRDDRKEDRKEMQEGAVEARAEMRGEVRVIREDDTRTKEERQAAMMEARANFEADMKMKREAFMAEQKERMEVFAKERVAARADLKVKISGIKDERRKEAAARVGENFNEINAKLTAQATQKVDKIEEVLGKVTARAAEVNANVTVQVEAAKTAIATARVAITLQTGKVYSVEANVTDETAKTAFGAVRKQLGDDMKVVQAAVRAAADSVRTVASSLPKPTVSASSETSATVNTQ